MSPKFVNHGNQSLMKYCVCGNRIITPSMFT